MVREPLVAGGFAFTVGTVFAPLAQPILISGLILILLTLTVYQRLKRGHIPVVPFLGAGLALGALVATSRMPDPAAIRAWAFAHAKDQAPISATIVESPERTPLGTSLIIDIDELRGRARVTTSTGCGDVGDRIAGVVRLAPDTSALAPSFRARSLAIMRGVAVAGVLADCRVTAAAGVRGPLASRVVAEDLRAIALGDKRGALAEGALHTRGQSQLLALGGVTFFALSILALWLAGQRWWWIAVAPIAALAWGIGFTPTIGRVSALVSCLCLARIGVGLLSARQALAVAAMVVCGVDPPALGDVAFQLSFAITTGWVGLAPVMHVHGRLPRVVANLIALALGTAPLISRQFDRISAASLAADAITVPLTVLAGAVSLVHERYGRPIFDAVLAIVARLPEGTWSTPSVLECVIAYAALAAAAAEKPTKRSTGAFVVMSLALLLVAGAPRLEQRMLPQARAYVLPVASGHSVLIEDDKGRVLLEGVGGAHVDPEANARLISSVLRTRRIFALDAVVASSTGTPTEIMLARSHDFTLRVVRDPRAVSFGGTALVIDGSSVKSADLTIEVEPPWAATSTAAWSTGRAGMITLIPLDGALEPKPYLR